MSKWAKVVSGTVLAIGLSITADAAPLQATCNNDKGKPVTFNINQNRVDFFRCRSVVDSWFTYQDRWIANSPNDDSNATIVGQPGGNCNLGTKVDFDESGTDRSLNTTCNDNGLKATITPVPE